MQERGARQSQAHSGAAASAHYPIHLPEHFQNVARSASASVRLAAGVCATSRPLRSPSGAHSTGPEDRITARSMKFCSSRMFPGQLCCFENLHHFIRDDVDLLVHALGEFAHEVPHQKRDVIHTLAQGRQGNGENVQAVKQIRPEPAFLNHLERSRLVAATMRTSTRMVRVLPSLSNSCSWSTRKSLGWSSSGMSPISSRNSVP